ncbi:MAG: hypothetical protein JW818_07090 [Pirellulales bacterium]|nr:hypothetical protein [Pirellulales bacterium]
MKRVNLQTRKPVDKLDLSDFTAYPVWEYADDEEAAEGQDETWVRPVDTSVVPNGGYCLVAVEFTAANGGKFDGFVTISTLDKSPDVCQGSIIDGAEHLFVSNSEACGRDESRTKLLKKLKLKEADLFPLAFRLGVPVARHKKYTGGTLP